MIYFLLLKWPGGMKVFWTLRVSGSSSLHDPQDQNFFHILCTCRDRSLTVSLRLWLRVSEFIHYLVHLSLTLPCFFSNNPRCPSITSVTVVSPLRRIGGWGPRSRISGLGEGHYYVLTGSKSHSPNDPGSQSGDEGERGGSVGPWRGVKVIRLGRTGESQSLTTKTRGTSTTFLRRNPRHPRRTEVTTKRRRVEERGTLTRVRRPRQSRRRHM